MIVVIKSLYSYAHVSKLIDTFTELLVVTLTSFRCKREIGGQRPVGGENNSIDLQDNIFMTRTPNIVFLVRYPWVPFLG